MAYVSQNPWTAEVLKNFPLLSSTEIFQRLQNADSAYHNWSLLNFEQRAACFMTLAQNLRQQQDKFAELIHLEMGKLLPEAKAEVIKSADACDYYAQHAQSLLQTETIKTDYSHCEVRYQSIGCVLGIMPWNFPLWQIIRFIAPTLMAGNTVLLKPAENTPQVALALEHLMLQSDFPQGAYQNLLIDNQQCAEVIASPTIKAVSLTGSEQAGRSVAATAGAALKKSVLELGGSDAFLVLNDADIIAAAHTAAISRFSNAGQTCIAAKRFIVVEDIADDFIHQLTHQAKKFILRPDDSANSTLAPMAKPALREALKQQVDASIKLGATVVLACEAGTGFSDYPASILDHVKKGMPAYQEEIFGPVACIIRVKDSQEAIRIANDTCFGLAASIWSKDSHAAADFANQLHCGSVFINTLVKSDVRLPFGGCKQSGFGRELSQLGIREFCNAKTVVIA
ncbi:MAG: NAD-dependent succinate-semialdehyde dehydrogenase [Pseudomonadales bacterium]|nr:NAD-dependent succinate-semialdehyde dehydrogenase [Pseudomonadales bacterium]